MQSVYDIAVALVRAGISVVPIKPDGSKAPAVTWQEYQRRLPNDNELAMWFKGRVRGLAAIGGSVSGGLECIDFDEPGLFDEYAAALDRTHPDLLSRCVVVKTPSVGAHVWYRAPQVAGNQKLAMRPPTDQERVEFPDARSYTRIETRGAGGYAIIPGSPPSCHPFGMPYEYTDTGRASLLEVQLITESERDVLLALAMSFNTFAEAPRSQTPPPAPRKGEGLSPGDDYERRSSWQDVLEPKGWHLESGTWDRGRLTRPGKDHGCSATVGICRGKSNEPLLFVFSSSAGIDCGSYGKFRAYSHLYHRGDYKAAAADLRSKGYGDQPPTRGSNAGENAPRVPSKEPTLQREDDKADLKVRSIKGRKVRPVKYLVEGKIPLGKVTMIAGVGGMGKSTLTRHLIACLTTGRPAFGLDYDPPPPCDVLLVSVEDSPEDTIVPHLIAEEADLDRVLMVEGVRRMEDQGEKEYLFDLRDLELVRKYLRANPHVRLLIIDPIMSFIGRAGLNENRSSEVRMLLDPLLAMADEMGIAIVLIAHLNKADKVAAVNRIVGSTAFRDTCRAVYFVGRDPDDDAKRVMALAKENVPGIDHRSIAFTREPLSNERMSAVLSREEFSELDAEDMARIEKQLAYVRPLGISNCDADGILGSSQSTEPKANKRVEPCMDWILAFLAEYAYPSDEVKAACIAAEFSKSTYIEACRRLGRNGNGKVESNNRRPISDDGEWWMGIGEPSKWIKRPKDQNSESPKVRKSESPKQQELGDIPD